MDQPRSSPLPATAESTAPLLTSLSLGAAHSCQVEDPALGSAVELVRSSACLSLRTAASTQRRLFTDSANLDSDDGVALNRVSKGSLEHMRVSKGSAKDRRVSRGSLEYRRVSKGGKDLVSPAVGQRQVPTAAVLDAALAGQQSMQRPPLAAPHSTMAPIAAVLIVMLLAIVAVCATHCIMVRWGSPGPVQLHRK